MRRAFAALLLALLCTLLSAGCATGRPEESVKTAPTRLDVDDRSVGHQVVAAVPPESAMERYETLDRGGRRFSYVAFTDTDYGGLLFLDDRLYGTLSRRDARAFYSCRGYVSATKYHWARDALDWSESLVAAATPAQRVTLNFSGRTTMQSVTTVARNPILSDVKSLLDMGTNPLSIIKTLTSAHSNMADRAKYDKTLQSLRSLAPGDSEQKLAAIVRPEDMSFTSDGLVMAYPRFLLDFYVNNGVVKVLQQPSFHRLSRLHAAVFYLPDLHWDKCTPGSWRDALPADWKPPPLEDDSSDFAFTRHDKDD